MTDYSKQKPVADATITELRDFARIAHGIQLTGNENTPQVLAKLNAVGFDTDREGAMITIIPTATGAEPKVPGSASTQYRRFNVQDQVSEPCDESDPHGELHQRITVHTAEGDGGNLPVPLWHNGTPFLVPRGKPVWVPTRYVGILNDAKMDIYDESGDDTRGLGDPRPVHAYPFSNA